jgi:hypothetical protein
MISEGPTVRRELAETIALQGLAWLASDPERFGHFCAATGAGPDTLAEQAGDPSALAGVLAFIALDDRWVVDFAASVDIPPESVSRAYAELAGDLPHWT